MLINHISNAYRAGVNEHEINRPNNHYSLYWQNGNHKSDRQRNHLVSLIQQYLRGWEPTLGGMMKERNMILP